ncbi:hypothetical protein ACA910_006712 [Epithemia clementina (nom. ined.)]
MSLLRISKYSRQEEPAHHSHPSPPPPPPPQDVPPLQRRRLQHIYYCRPLAHDRRALTRTNSTHSAATTTGAVFLLLSFLVLISQHPVSPFLLIRSKNHNMDTIPLVNNNNNNDINVQSCSTKHSRKDNDPCWNGHHNNKRPRLSVDHQGLRASSSPNGDSSSSSPSDDAAADAASMRVGRLEELKQLEASLAAQLAAVRREKRQALQQSRPLRIGIIGFGRFGQFIAKAFVKHGHEVIVTSRSDYTDMANAMNVQYVPLDQPEQFFFSSSSSLESTFANSTVNGDSDLNGQVLKHNKNNDNNMLDIIVFCVSIVSFEDTVRSMLPYIQRDLELRRTQLNDDTTFSITTTIEGPLVVDVLSVKEHPRKVLLDLMPPQVDLLLTHPMFGPDSGKDGWKGLTFVYEKTRIRGVLCDDPQRTLRSNNTENDSTIIADRPIVEAVDRMERFLSIWEEEGCAMVEMSCREHDAYAANSQFITHLMGRILGAQKGLQPTPIDTSGFKNVLKLVDRTTADSFELFYGLFKFNQNSHATILNLRAAMDDVVARLYSKEREEEAAVVASATQTKATTVVQQQQQQQQQMHLQNDSQVKN